MGVKTLWFNPEFFDSLICFPRMICPSLNDRCLYPDRTLEERYIGRTLLYQLGSKTSFDKPCDWHRSNWKRVFQLACWLLILLAFPHHRANFHTQMTLFSRAQHWATVIALALCDHSSEPWLALNVGTSPVCCINTGSTLTVGKLHGL